MIRHFPKMLMVIGAVTLAASRVGAAWDYWNCHLQAHWGAPDGLPHDTTTFLGVCPGATDGYDAVLDAKKPAEPVGHHV